MVIAQLLAEGAARVLIVLPRPLLGQWQNELYDLFGMTAEEAADPAVDIAADGVFLAGREYAGGEAGLRRLSDAPPFDLCLIDEAHEVFAGIHRRFDRGGNLQRGQPLRSHRPSGPADHRGIAGAAAHGNADSELAE